MAALRRALISLFFQLTVLAGLQHTELDGTLGAAAQAHDLQADRGAHAADLAVAALVQGDLQHRAAGFIHHNMDDGGLGFTPSSSTTPLDI